jgi:hypothetical protein
MSSITFMLLVLQSTLHDYPISFCVMASILNPPQPRVVHCFFCHPQSLTETPGLGGIHPPHEIPLAPRTRQKMPTSLIPLHPDLRRPVRGLDDPACDTAYVDLSERRERQPTAETGKVVVLRRSLTVVIYKSECAITLQPRRRSLTTPTRTATPA